jgi:hypothetical protein
MGQRMGFPVSTGGGGGAIAEVESTDATINVTNPTGPDVNLSIADVVTAAGISITDDSAGGITIAENGAGGLTLAAGANNGVILGVTEGLTLSGSEGGVYLIGLPTTDPGGSNALWNLNGLVVFSTISYLPLTNDDYALCIGQVILDSASAVSVGTSQSYLLSARVFPIGESRTTFTTLPSVIASNSPVVIIGSGSLTWSVTNVDTTTDDLTIAAQLTVSDTVGSNVIVISATANIAESGPGQSGAIDWTTGTPTVLAGTDLSWDPTIGVSSVAGGIFAANLSCNTSWD